MAKFFGIDTKFTDQGAQDNAWTGTFFTICIVVGLIAAVFHQISSASTILLWSMCCLASGAAVGFLFGIPRVLQLDPKDDKISRSDYRQQVNTNLVEISDWLTKIIVGLSLIHLKELPKAIGHNGRILAGDLGNVGQHSAFSFSLIVYFSIVGFLFGYVQTRLFLALAFSRADQTATRRAQEAQIDSVSTDIEQLKQAVYDNRNPTEDPSKEQLLALAQEYGSIHHPDLRVRVDKKDKSASRIGSYILANRVSRDYLVKMIEDPNTSKELGRGLIAGLANAIHLEPQSGDTERLISVADRPDWKHTQYAIVRAFGRLFDRGFASSSDRPRVEAILSHYLAKADDSLRTFIHNTRSRIDEALRR